MRQVQEQCEESDSYDLDRAPIYLVIIVLYTLNCIIVFFILVHWTLSFYWQKKEKVIWGEQIPIVGAISNATQLGKLLILELFFRNCTYLKAVLMLGTW